MDPGSVALCTKVPAEIWLRIWHSSSRRDLQNLVFVCRYFRDLCQPLIFRHQRFTAPQLNDVYAGNWMSVTRHLHNSQIRLRKLAAHTHASAVRIWHFDGSLKLAGLVQNHPRISHIHLIPETYAQVVQTFCTTLGNYQNLRSLHVSAFIVDPAFREILTSLGRLEHLDMEGCRIQGRTGPLLALRHLSLTASRRFSFMPSSQRLLAKAPKKPIRITSPETLRTLTIDGSRNACALLPALHSNNIVNLHIKLSEVAQERSLALAFLEHCPHVAYIEISCPSTLVGTVPRSLPPTAISNLRSFKGPLSLGGLFTSDRPVDIVEFSGPVRRKEEITKGLSAIAHTSVALHSLSLDIPMEALVDISAAIKTHFPELGELSLWISGPGAMEASGYNGFTYSSDSESETDGATYAFNWGWDDPDRGRFSTLEVDKRTIELLDSDDFVPLSTGLRADQVPSSSNHPQPNPVEDPVEDHVEEPSLFVSDDDDFGSFDSDSLREISTRAAHDSATSAVEEVIDIICAGGISLPPRLTDLRFKGVVFQDSHGPLAVQRRVVLALEQQLPALKNVSFARAPQFNKHSRRFNVWTRDDDTWSQHGSGAIIPSLVRRGQ
ncbi:hypothetical protein DFH09DRAFT_1361208 [Mycena vulgaris]|nr:hypothetical protein DFH09DRAFT_1361208 [Mycena vulgaris]